MSTVILDTPFPAMHIVEKVAFSTEGCSIRISLNSQSESISNEQLLKMFEAVIQSPPLTYPLIACKKPTQAFVVDVNDVVMTPRGVSMNDKGHVVLECFYVLNYFSLMLSGTITNGEGMLHPVTRTFGGKRHALVSLYLALVPNGTNIIHRNSANSQS